METEMSSIKINTTAISEIVNNINITISSFSFDKTQTVSSFSCLTSVGIGTSLINAICSSLDGMLTNLKQINQDLSEIVEAQEKIDEEINKASLPYVENFKNENEFSPIDSNVTSLKAIDGAKHLYSKNVGISNGGEQIDEEKVNINNIRKNASDSIIDQKVESMNNVINRAPLKGMSSGETGNSIEFDYEEYNELKQQILQSPTVNEEALQELFDYEVSAFYLYLKEISDKNKLFSIKNILNNTDILNSYISDYDQSSASIKLSDFPTKVILNKLNSIFDKE